MTRVEEEKLEKEKKVLQDKIEQLIEKSYKLDKIGKLKLF